MIERQKYCVEGGRERVGDGGAVRMIQLLPP